MIIVGQMKKMKNLKAKITATLIVFTFVAIIAGGVLFPEHAVRIAGYIGIAAGLFVVGAMLCALWQWIYDSIKDETTVSEEASGSDDTQYPDFYD